jgi:FemAB family protein
MAIASQPMDEIRSGWSLWLQESGLQAVMRMDNAKPWEEAWEGQIFQSTHYAASMIDYQHAYLKNAYQTAFDMSMVLLHDGRPCAIWPLTIVVGANVRLSTCGSAILPPTFVANLSPRTIKKITANALDFIKRVQSALAVDRFQCTEWLVPKALANGLTEWHQQWLSLGASVGIKHDLYIDLTIGLEEIKANFRKSYRPLINAAGKLWSVHVMDSSCSSEDCWNEFKALHCQVAGRITRSDQSWQLQYQMIKADEAMLINLRDPANGNRMIGAGFFQMTRDQAQYAVAAYDRELFDQPIGHLVQMRAIEQMKIRQISWYEIGERLFPCDQPSEKELAISLFKQGFATHLSPRFLMDLDLASQNTMAHTSKSGV